MPELWVHDDTRQTILIEWRNEPKDAWKTLIRLANVEASHLGRLLTSLGEEDLSVDLPIKVLECRTGKEI